MKKVVLSVVLIVSVMLAVSCKSTPKDTDRPYVRLYDANSGLDLTGAASYTVRQGDTLSDISRSFYIMTVFIIRLLCLLPAAS